MLRIGRSKNNDIVTPPNEKSVSGSHAFLSIEDGRLVIIDNYSTNGVYVNGRRIPPGQSTPVLPNSDILLGDYRFVVNEKDPKINSLNSSVGQGLDDCKLMIGRSADNHLVIGEPDVSKHHAEIFSSNGRLFIKDCSTNGTFLNSIENKIPTSQITSLQPADTIYIASHALPPEKWYGLLRRLGGKGAIRPVVAEGFEATSQPQHYVKALVSDVKAEVTIGRRKDNDIVIAEPTISSHHARILRKGEKFIIEDLGSTNGTFINGKRLRDAAEITAQSDIRLANQQLYVDFSKLQQNQLGVMTDGSIHLDVNDLVYQIPNRRNHGKMLRLLDEVSLSVNPGEMLAIMGPSGSGKTTLLYFLIGSMSPTTGGIYYNGKNLSKNFDSFRTAIGYVSQDDILYPQLTVFESLYYTCKLRLPPETSDDDIKQRIDQVLQDLGFNIHIPEMDIRHRRIGSPEQKVLSGGQRKRINVAQELITNPKILFLDEPTSGLAAKDAKELIKLLKVLSERDRVAVILTIHQPSYELFSMFSNTLLLSPGGIQAYFGSAVPGAFDYLQLNKHNPDDLLDKVDVPFPENQQLKKRYRQSPYYQTFITNRQKSRAQTQEIEQKDWRRPGIRQFLTLTARNFKLKWKDIWGGTGILLLQAPIIAFLVFVALNNTKSQVEQTKVLFLLIISAIWFGCNNSAREIVAERLIYSRERMVNLKIPSYFLSKLVIMIIICGFQCLVLLACNYGPCNLPGSFLSLYGVLLLTALSAACMGLFLSAIVKTNEAAIGMVPILLLPQVILAGMLVKLGTNKLIDLLAKLTISRWSYEALLNISFPEVLASNIIPRQEGTFIEYLGFAENRLGMDSFVLVWITCFFLMGSFLLLYLRDNHK